MFSDVRDQVLTAILQELRLGDGLLVIHDEADAPRVRDAFSHATWMLGASGRNDEEHGARWAEAWQRLLDRQPDLVRPADERSNIRITEVEDLWEHLLLRDFILPMHLTGSRDPRAFAGALARSFGRGWKAEAQVRERALTQEYPWHRYEGEGLIELLSEGDPSPHLRFDETTDWLLARASHQAPVAVVCLVDSADLLLGSQNEGWQVELAESWRQAIDRTRGRPVRFLSVLAMSRTGYTSAIKSAAYSPISTVLSRHRHFLEV